MNTTFSCCVFLSICFSSIAYYSHTTTTNRKSFLLSQPFRVLRLQASTVDDAANRILRRVDNWACVRNCGACCKLGPLDSRPDLDSYLTGYFCKCTLHQCSLLIFKY